MIIKRDVLYFYIERLKQRLDAINQLRIDRALSSAIGKNFKNVYSLLPILLHFHHPMLPGYLEGHVPHGICFYRPDKTQCAWLDEINFQTNGIISSIVTSHHSHDDNSEKLIIGVYSMGSTSSIGQNAHSDLDIWVCHQSWLDNESRAQLRKKCGLIKQWAIRQGVDVNFFLMDENRFRHNESGFLDDDDCGSTQHILLLDEFYRTVVRMGGKRVLWHIVPKEAESHYDEYVLSLYACGALIPNEWLDLGGLGTLSAEEYFSASLWQLYKSIHSPYKGVLKTLLLEAYSLEYPNTELLAMHIKQRLHNGEIVSCYGLDPYCMMLERLTSYLTKINDMTRLDIVRRCFYLKACEKLSHNSTIGTRWRKDILTQLVKAWGWNDDRLRILDNCPHYLDIEQISAAAPQHDNELLNIMMHSYRNLIQFFRHHHLSVSVSSQDIAVLIKKLYVAFESLPGKIPLLNLNLQSSPQSYRRKF